MCVHFSARRKRTARLFNASSRSATAGQGGWDCSTGWLAFLTAVVASGLQDATDSFHSRVEGVDDQRQQLVDVALDCTGTSGAGAEQAAGSGERTGSSLCRLGKSAGAN